MSLLFQPIKEPLIEKILSGDRSALEGLVAAHQSYLVNFARRMVMNPDDAQDIAQEVWIKAITHLSTFAGKSSFRTWLTRIAINHILNMKQTAQERAVTNFTAYGEGLDNIPDIDPMTAGLSKYDLPLLVEEVKIGCMSGMLLCLNREQRIVYILGAIFAATDQEGAEILDITPENFRQKLARARRDIHSFMNDKCGLINQDNPCRCAKKTKAFIDLGWVDPQKLKFADPHLQSVRAVAGERNDQLCDLMDRQYGALFQDHPFYQSPDRLRLLSVLLNDPRVKAIMDLE